MLSSVNWSLQQLSQDTEEPMSATAADCCSSAFLGMCTKSFLKAFSDTCLDVVVGLVASG